MTFIEALNLVQPGESIARKTWHRKRSFEINRFEQLQHNGYLLTRSDYLANDWEIITMEEFLQTLIGK